MWHVNGYVVRWVIIVNIMWAVKVVVGFKHDGMDFPYSFINTKDGGRGKWDLLSTSLLSISLLIFISNLNYWGKEVKYVYLFKTCIYIMVL